MLYYAQIIIHKEGYIMEHIKTLNTKNLQNTVKKGGCGDCLLYTSDAADEL